MRALSLTLCMTLGLDCKEVWLPLCFYVEEGAPVLALWSEVGFWGKSDCPQSLYFSNAPNVLFVESDQS